MRSYRWLGALNAALDLLSLAKYLAGSGPPVPNGLHHRADLGESAAEIPQEGKRAGRVELEVRPEPFKVVHLTLDADQVALALDADLADAALARVVEDGRFTHAAPPWCWRKRHHPSCGCPFLGQQTTGPTGS